MTTNVILTGFRELEAALSELPKATGRNVLRRIGKGALEPMADRASERAPVEEGKLSFSIAVSEGRTRRAKRSRRFDRKTGLEMAMGPASGSGALNYASFVEFGTSDTSPQPYMRPAWDAGAQKALDHIKDALADEIGRAAKRIAGKRARSGG